MLLEGLRVKEWETRQEDGSLWGGRVVKGRSGDDTPSRKINP